MSKIFKIAFVVMAIAAMAAPGIVTDAHAVGGAKIGLKGK